MKHRHIPQPPQRLSPAAAVGLAVITLPVLAGATIVSATFGPLGAIGYVVLLLGGVNARHLFRDRRNR